MIYILVLDYPFSHTISLECFGVPFLSIILQKKSQLLFTISDSSRFFGLLEKGEWKNSLVEFFFIVFWKLPRIVFIEYLVQLFFLGLSWVSGVGDECFLKRGKELSTKHFISRENFQERCTHSILSNPSHVCSCYNHHVILLQGLN